MIDSPSLRLSVNVIVIGSGLIGVTTAYFLRRCGYEVMVIDRQQGPGLETSFANGALLTPGMSDPWNTPGCWRLLLSSLVRPDAPLQLRLHALPALTGWGIRFLRHSTSAAFERNTRSNLRLALHSLEVMESLRRETGIEYARTAKGSLKLFRHRVSLDRACATASRLSRAGLIFRKLSSAETVAIEPALGPIADRLAGAIYYLADETGDAYRFCMALAAIAQTQGVEFRFRTAVSSLEARSGQVTAIVSGRERFIADRYVVAAGSYSTQILRGVGIHLPVTPAKGYSVTLEDSRIRPSLGMPLIDDHLHAAIVPLEGAIRVAGTAEFAGYDLTMNADRTGNLLRLVQEVLLQAQLDASSAKLWCGLRPMSADGVPIIGHTPLANLFINSGHGHLGWTMAAGSARMIAQLLSADAPAIDPAPYALARFG